MRSIIATGRGSRLYKAIGTVRESRFYKTFASLMLLFPVAWVVMCNFGSWAEDLKTPTLVVETTRIRYDGQEWHACRLKRLKGGSEKNLGSFVLVATAKEGWELKPQIPIADGSLPDFEPGGALIPHRATLPLVSIPVGSGLVWPLVPVGGSSKGEVLTCHLPPRSSCQGSGYAIVSSDASAVPNWIASHWWLEFGIILAGLSPAGVGILSKLLDMTLLGRR